MHFGYVHNNITLSVTVDDRNKRELIECVEELHRICGVLDSVIQDLEQEDNGFCEPQGP